jgi:DNA polymerase III delta prime subunit
MTTILYVLANGDQSNLAKMVRVCAVRAQAGRAQRSAPRSLPSVESCSAPPVTDVVVKFVADAQITARCDVVLLQHNLDAAFVAHCRATARRVFLSTVSREMADWRVVDETTALICERLKPRLPADLLKTSRIWYNLLKDHVMRAVPQRLMVLCGRVGCGKTCLIDVLVHELGVALTQFVDTNADDDGDEENIWDAVGSVANRPRKDKRISLIVVDNADTLKQSKLANEALRRVVSSTNRVAIVFIANNWFARGGVINAMRTRADTKRRPQKADAKTSSKRDVLDRLEIVRVDCDLIQPGEIEEHLRKCLPQSSGAARGVIAHECGGDVRSAMQRLDMETRLKSATNDKSQRDEFARNSPDYQLRDAVEEMATQADRLRKLPPARISKEIALKRALAADFSAPVERRFQTLDTMDTARELLFANYPRMLEDLGTTDVTLEQAKSFETRFNDTLETTCNMVDCMSDADILRTLEMRSSHQGSSMNAPLAFGVSLPAKMLATRGLKRNAKLQMDFTGMQLQSRMRENAAVLATLDPLIRVGSLNLSNEVPVEAMRTMSLRDQPLNVSNTAITSIGAIERVSGLGRYTSSHTVADYGERSWRLRFSDVAIRKLGGLKRGSPADGCRPAIPPQPAMMNAYQIELRAISADRQQAQRLFAGALSRELALQTAALRAGALMLTESEFAMATVYADSLRCGFDQRVNWLVPGSQDEPRNSALVTAAEAIKAFRVAKNSEAGRSIGMHKRRRIDVEQPVHKRGKKADKLKPAPDAPQKKVENDDGDEDAN